MTKSFFSATLVVLVLLLPSVMQAKVEHLLPRPQQVTVNGGEAFALGRPVTISYSGDAKACVLLEKFFKDNGCEITSGGAAVNVSLVDSIVGAYDYTLYGYDNEAYTLEISANAIDIKAVTATGVIRAVQTLTQLAEGYEGAAKLEALTMTDWPAFKLRGYMHDVGRSFIEFETLKKHIDLLSRFKVNTFHWHMTENQAWRFEVKAYPQLTSSASMTRFAGKYYTQEQCRELQDYAIERGVVVIPEIDMPGHSEAFVRAMGYDMQTDNGVVALKTILEEVVAVFDKVPYIHIGADEKSITYTNFLKIMTDKVHALGKKVVVWNPISGVAITTGTGADMTQMWSSSGKVINGMPNIDCRYNYTNHFDVFADLVGIYKSNIYYAEKGCSDIAGTISAPWNDRKTPTEEDIIKQNNFYANVIASAERAWIGGGKQYIEKGGTTLPNSGEEYDEFADWERRFLFHKANSLKDEPIPYVKQTNVRWRITDAFPNGGNASMKFAPEEVGTKDSTDLIAESFVYNGKTYYTGIATGAGIYLRHTWGNNTVPTYYGSTNYNNVTSYAWTYIYSDTLQTVGAQIEFQNYGRSEKDAAPDNGKWDRKGSDIWLNGEKIAPPQWDNSGVGINNEVDLKNENFTARKPLPVTLKKGWNKVFIKLPYVGASGVRLNKWLFTFVLTDLEGVNAVEGLVYSPNKRLDVVADRLAAVISDMEKEITNCTGDEAGQCGRECAAELERVMAKIGATLDEVMSEADRKAQMEELKVAFEAFKKALETALVNIPLKVSDDGNEYFYTMCTPQRDNRYPTSKGNAAEIVGESSVTDAAKWKFVARADGKYDIVNKSDKTYISPASSYNTALRTQSSSPEKGWVLKPAATEGLFIIVSDDVQFNQTNSGHGYKVYNWGNGTNINDAGCQYKFVDEDGNDLGNGGESDIEVPKSFLSIAELEGKAYPYAIADEQAQQVFEKENITVAVDVTMSGSMSGRGAIVCVADPTQAITGATKVNSPYVAYGLYGNNPAYLPSSRGEDRFTYRDFTFSPSVDYKVVYVIDKASQFFLIYVNGALKTTAEYPVGGYELQSFYNFRENSSAKLYVGGGVVSSNSQYDLFGGTVRSVHFFDKALDAEAVANIDYSFVTEGNSGATAIECISSDNGTASGIFDIVGRKVNEVVNPGIYIINGEKRVIR